jgi:uncharacterized surface protein with fasciclin (FAS1) repeats
MYCLKQSPALSKFKYVLLLCAVLAMTSCKEEPQLWEPGSEQLVIGDYIATNPDQFSEFGKLADIAGMHSLLKIRGPYTLLLPTNEAMMEYYSLKGVSGLDDLGEAFCEELFRNHFITNEIATGDIGLGALPFENGLGDFLASEFNGSDIIISKSAKIIKRDILCANGIIQVLDKVLNPNNQDLFTVVSLDPSYKIFTEGLRLTGLMDTLKIISFPYGTGEARTRFTLLAVADSIYNRYGINSVEDLMEWCGANPDSITFLENPFYRYIEYHCLHGCHFLSDMNTGVYPILSRDNNVLLTIDTDYKINYDKLTDEYTGFIIPASNTPAKNGVLHAVDDLMPPIKPTPVRVLFEVTDFFDVKQGDYYLSYFQKFFDGENTFEKVKWRGPYLQYYFHEESTWNMNGDVFAIQLGWWEVSITFPKVMKGEYDVILKEPPWDDVADCRVYLDGEATGILYRGDGGTGVGGPQVIAHALFETTAEHTITIRNVTNGMLFWDWVEFVPASSK